jgi:putative endonuclease
MATYHLFFVYILFSEQHDKFYVGHTNDLIRRILEHNDPLGKRFTTKFQPWELVAAFPFSTRGQAILIERYIKKQKKRSFIRGLCEDDTAFDFLQSKLPKDKDAG